MRKRLHTRAFFQRRVSIVVDEASIGIVLEQHVHNMSVAKEARRGERRIAVHILRIDICEALEIADVACSLSRDE